MAVPGLDLARLAGTLAQAPDCGVRGPLSAEVISGGRSNLTYRVRGETGEVVVRRPPLGHVLPSAHDMSREYRVTSALWAAGFPVARPLLLCTDEDVIGAPFYVMEYVDGIVLRRTGSAEEVAAVEALDPAGAWRCGEQLLDLLLRLHRVDYVAAGLGEFGRPEGYLHRQVTRWHKQWVSSQTRELPLLDRVSETLLATVPPSPPPTIVHGDYRLDNVMFRRDLSGIVAVMDWEMATLGDPLSDVGMLIVYTDMPAGGGITPRPPAGYPTGAEFARRYAAGSGIDAARLDWYIAFATYKLAVIAEGIHARYLQGKTVGEGFARAGEGVPILIERAASTLNIG
ncbi:MAG TPA: phosphotransferase family protein [Rugosimonospora sp.]|nr:phosphotransferase family protein [Rugosimonospora sp.]